MSERRSAEPATPLFMGSSSFIAFRPPTPLSHTPDNGLAAGRDRDVLDEDAPLTATMGQSPSPRSWFSPRFAP